LYDPEDDDRHEDDENHHGEVHQMFLTLRAKIVHIFVLVQKFELAFEINFDFCN